MTPLLGRQLGLEDQPSKEVTASNELGVPEYRVVEEGPDRLKEFTATAVIAGWSGEIDSAKIS